MTSSHKRLRENLDSLRARIDAAASRAGRDPREIALVGVTKYVEPEMARQIVEAGLRDLGESRPQELWRKAAALACGRPDKQAAALAGSRPDEQSAALAGGRPDKQSAAVGEGTLPLTWPTPRERAAVSAEPVHQIDVPRWHLIGHLQRNKLRRTLPIVSLWHSGDSRRVLEDAHAEAIALGRRMALLIEVNISGEAAKHGFTPDELLSLGDSLANWPAFDVRGLMAMAALDTVPEDAARDFAAVRALAERLRAIWPANVSLDELSMGMSGDFEVAIAEGATIVRVGSALFEGIESRANQSSSASEQQESEST